MKKFRELKISAAEENLVNLLQKLKQANNYEFVFQKKATEDYANNMFVDGNHLACFKTSKQALFGAYVWMMIEDGLLQVVNITSDLESNLGIDNYNLVIDSFYNNFLKKILLEQEICWVKMSLPNANPEDILGSKECWEALQRWSNVCNKTSPLVNEMEYRLWLDFVFILHRQNVTLYYNELTRLLLDDLQWPDTYINIIQEIETRLGQTQFILKYYDNYRENN